MDKQLPPEWPEIRDSFLKQLEGQSGPFADWLRELLVNANWHMAEDPCDAESAAEEDRYEPIAERLISNAMDQMEHGGWLDQRWWWDEEDEILRVEVAPGLALLRSLGRQDEVIVHDIEHVHLTAVASHFDDPVITAGNAEEGGKEVTVEGKVHGVETMLSIYFSPLPDARVLGVIDTRDCERRNAQKAAAETKPPFSDLTVELFNRFIQRTKEKGEENKG